MWSWQINSFDNILSFFRVVLLSLHQDVSHGLDVLLNQSLLSTQYVASFPQVLESSKFPLVPNPILESHFMQSRPLIASNDADSCFGITSVFAHGVKPLLVTLIELQGGLRTNRQLPRFTIQWSAAVLPISNHSGIQGIGIPVNCNKFEQVLNLHTEADLGEWCVPVGGKFGLLWVKPSLPSVKVKGFFVASIRGINCSETTGSPRSKYEHRRTSALLHNIRNIRICMGKNYRFCYLKKKKTAYLTENVCVTSLLCGPLADLWPFCGFLSKRFSHHEGGVRRVRKPQNRTEKRQKTANRIGFFPEYGNRAYM